MILLKGKPAADRLSAEIEEITAPLIKAGKIPTAAILRVGNSADDIAYENMIVKKAASFGFNTVRITLDENVSDGDVIAEIDKINADAGIHGAIMMRPLPKHLNEDVIRNRLAPEKDIDAISDNTVSRLFIGKDVRFAPCTAEAVMQMLDYYGVPVSGKKVVVIGRSLVIGKPVAMLLMNANATVTVCHSRTPEEDIKSCCREADIIVCAAGKAGMLKADYVTGKQTIIDVGMNFDADGRPTGDADMADLDGKAEAITPVPGGVGAVTNAVLMHHLAKACAAE